MNRTYLDWAATAYFDKEILEETLKQSCNYFANPSSPHKQGKESIYFINQCRKKLSEFWRVDADNLFFTSGGTESNNIIISSLINKKRIGNCVISAVEHSSVYEPAIYLKNFGWEIREVKPNKSGQISKNDFLAAVDDNTRFASIMMINNETGAIQPAAEIGELLSKKKKRRQIHFHIDAVQAACKYHLNLTETGADSAAISSHKFQGPRGAGLLYLKKNIKPIFYGGGQEKNLRSGTENIFGITGTLLAAQKANLKIETNLSQALLLKKELISRLSEIDGLKFNPNVPIENILDSSKFSPYILSVNIKPIPGEIIVRLMSDRGFDISTGSACSAGKKAERRVLESFGLSKEDAYSSIRVSTGCNTKLEDIVSFCSTLKQEIDAIRRNL